MVDYGEAAVIKSPRCERLVKRRCITFSRKATVSHPALRQSNVRTLARPRMSFSTTASFRWVRWTGWIASPARSRWTSMPDRPTNSSRSITCSVRGSSPFRNPPASWCFRWEPWAWLGVAESGGHDNAWSRFGSCVKVPDRLVARCIVRCVVRHQPAVKRLNLWPRSSDNDEGGSRCETPVPDGP